VEAAREKQVRSVEPKRRQNPGENNFKTMRSIAIADYC